MNRNTILAMILLFLLVSIGLAFASENLDSAKRLLEAQEYTKACEILRKLTEKDPSNAAAWVLLGNSYGRLGEDKDAIEAYEKAIGIDPENEEAFFGLGACYSKMHKHLFAIEAYKKVIELNPNHAAAHFELGFTYDRTASLTKAFEQYKILKNLDEDLADKLYHIILGD